MLYYYNAAWHPQNAVYWNGDYVYFWLIIFGTPLQYAIFLWIVWVRSFIEPELFDNNVPFDNTIQIYLINLLWKLALGLGLDLELHYFSTLHGE